MSSRPTMRGPERTRAVIPVGGGDGGYPVIVQRGLLTELPALLAERVGARRYAIVSDDTVAPLHAEPLAGACREEGLDVVVLTFPAGEASKTRATWTSLTDRMLDAGFGRDACIVAVGGGVTTDLGGFLAATYMRGLPVVQVPTSYLAMIDASVGGKTGVDTRHGKNLVGAFHAPAFVAADPEVLATLPRSERAEGLVEAFKHGAILDARYFRELSASTEALLAAEPDVIVRAVRRSVELKATVVTEDERENGYRQILNFGHTVGHALEAAAGFGLGHGSAVAIGMLVEARVGERLGVTAEGTADSIRSAVEPLRRVAAAPIPPRPSEIRPFLGADKKVRGGRTRYVLLRSVGTTDPGRGWTTEVADEVVVAALEEILT